MLTRKQRRLQREVTDLLELLHLAPDVSAVGSEWRTTHLELAKRELIIGAVLRQYLLMDEHLNNEICREFFPRRAFQELWRTKRFRVFNYHVLERLYVLQKVEFVRARTHLPKKVYRDILALNDVRNALAHSFFPENRRVKPLWKGVDIFSKAGFDQFWEDMGEASDVFFARIRQRNRRQPINRSE